MLAILPAPIEIMGDEGRMVYALHGRTDEGECPAVLHEESNTAMTRVPVESFRLALGEAEVRYWAIHGKTNRDIGDITSCFRRSTNS